MGNFEQAIPKHIDTLEKELGTKRRDMWDIQKQFNHDCDCEYCTVDNEDPDEESQAEIDELQAAANDIIETIKRLKRHAEIHNVTLPSKIKKTLIGGPSQ